MNKEQARKIFEATRRFDSRNGNIMIRDMALADQIAQIKAERAATHQRVADPVLAAYAA